MDVHQQDLRFFKRPKNPYHSVAVPRRKRRTEGCAKTEEFYRINEVTSKQRKHDADLGNNIVATGQSAREVAEDLDIPKSTVFITSGYNPSASVAAKGML